MGDPRRDEAPEVLETLAVACESVRNVVDRDLLELARLRVAALLGNEPELMARPWADVDPVKVAALASWSTNPLFTDRDRAALGLTEQFVIDVTGVLAGPLGAAFGALGDQLGPFVQGLYLLDVGQRIAMVLGPLFGATVTSSDWAWDAEGDEVPVDPMEAIMEMMAAVGRLQRVDPVVKELLRLRGARLHQCRRCQSVRSVTAVNAGATEGLLGAADPREHGVLPEATSAALELFDATFAGQPGVSQVLSERLAASYNRSEIAELTSYLLRNACNKIPVAFGVDDAIVAEGFEYQIIDANGETVTVDHSALN